MFGIFKGRNQESDKASERWLGELRNVQSPRIQWQTDFLHPRRVNSITRASAILYELTGSGPLTLEIQVALKREGTKELLRQAQLRWLAFTRGWLDIFSHVQTTLSTRASITIVGKESSLIKSALSQLGQKGEIRVSTFQAKDSVDGAIAIQHLGQLEARSIQHELRTWFRRLRPGGVVCVYEPIPSMAEDSNQLRRALLDAARDAILVQAPFDEFDLALVAYNESLKLKKVRTWFQPEELSDSAGRAGFQIIERTRALYGTFIRLVIRKPEPRTGDLRKKLSKS